MNELATKEPADANAKPTATEGAATSIPDPAAVRTDMHIKVYSPFHIYFDDIAKSISAVNDTGPFDILPGHRNFMTLVSACELIIRTPSAQEEKIKISRAVMHVKADEVRVFLDV